MPEPVMTAEGKGVGNRRAITAALFALVCLTAFLVYRGSTHNEFVWDDPIVLGQQLQAFHSMSDVFFPPPRIPQFGGLYYRPMILVSYMMDRAILGDTPFAFHFPVVLMHSLNSGLVFLLGIVLFGVGSRAGSLRPGAGTLRVLAALGGALLFATHPIHTESVCWMAGRSDNLATLFLIPALLCYLRWKGHRGRWGWLVVAAALFLLACLSKETAAGFLLIVGAADLLGIGDPAVAAQADRVAARAAPARSAGAGPGKGAGPRKAGKDERRAGGKALREAAPVHPTIPFVGWAALGAAFVAYWALRQKALSAYPETLHQASPDPVIQVKNVLTAIGFYVGKIFVPVHLDAYIPNIPFPGLNLAIGVMTIALVSVLLWLVVSRGERTIGFLILFFFGALVPSLAIAFFQISEAPVAERYLYIPSVGFCLLLGYLGFVKLVGLLARFSGVDEGEDRDRREEASLEDSAVGTTSPSRGALVSFVVIVAVGTLALSGVYAAMTVRRERDWKADLAFWTDGVAKSPNEGLPHLHRGLALANLGRADEAEAEYKLAIDPNVEYDAEGRSTALNNLGMLYMGKSELDEADQYFEQAIRMRPEYPTPYYGIGVTSLRRGEMQGKSGRVEEATRSYEKSEAYFTHAIELNPQYVKAHNQLGYLFATTGRTRPALEHLDRVLKLVSRGSDYAFAKNLKEQIEQRTGRP